MNVLIIAAHPDDELLGAGATILRLNREGHNVSILTMSHRSVTRENELLEEQKETDKILGIKNRTNLDYEMMKFGQYDRHAMVKSIEDEIVLREPDIIITHFHGDIHNDHRITNEIALEAARIPQRMLKYHRPLRAFMTMEVLSSTDWGTRELFNPSLYIEIQQSDIEKITDALRCYKDVVRPVPHPRNKETMRSLARIRGAEIGVKYAEAFELVFGRI